MKKILLLIAVIAATIPAMAQRTITGKVVESDTKEALAMTTVKLLKTDSTLVKGVLTSENGNFSITAPSNGKYILKITNIGFKGYTRNITVNSSNNIDLGTISVSPDAIMLKGATVTANLAKVTLKEDTFIYNAGAYRTPEGSAVEELVKRLPGAQVDDDGKITINGKEVKKILIDGKEFMTGDTKTAMKNLPTSIVEKVKAYDEKSDMARISGIDDGEEQTVLDFGVKKGMNKGLFSNVDLAAGTQERYAAKAMAARFNSTLKVIAMGNANNINDMGFGSGGRFGGGRGRSGLNASKMAGVNINYEEKDKLKISGSIRWNHSDGDAYSKSSSENFVSTASSFSNSINKNLSRGNSWNAQMRLEWMPDTMTNIMFRPDFSYSKNDGVSNSQSATYNEDPYLYVTNPLDAEAIARLAKDSLMVNHRVNRSVTYSDSKRFGGSLQINRKLNSYGRNITLRIRGNYTESNNQSLQTNNVHLFQTLNSMGLDSTYQTNRYNLTPAKNYNYSARLSYSEPIMKGTFLQLSYDFQYKHSKSDRATYDFSNLGENFFEGLTPAYRDFNSWLSRLENPFDTYLDDSLSRYSEYNTYTHDINLTLRVIRKAYNLNLGVAVMPQKTHFIQQYQGNNADTTRNVVDITPNVDFRWKISKVSQLRAFYRGYSSQPSMTDLLDITDNSDPLYITKGNPGLKPAFTNSFNLFYNNYIQKRQQAIMFNMVFNTTRNSISRKVTYNETTGGSTSQPENINGNWDARGAFMYNTSIDTTGLFYVNTFTEMSYKNDVGYLSLDRNSDSRKNVTKDMALSERIAAGMRNSWLEFELTGYARYNHATNKLQSRSNLDTWQFSYGCNANIALPWGTTLATDLNMSSRRGYNDASLNTNELIWNAQISQGFMKKALTVSLQFYDILKQQSNFSRTISAMQRHDVEYNAITSFAMLHVIYKINLFGSKDARREMREGPGGFGGPGNGQRGGNRGGNRGGFRAPMF